MNVQTLCFLTMKHKLTGKVIADDQKCLWLLTGLVGIIVIRLKACVVTWFILSLWVFMCLSVYVNKVKNRTSVETYFLHTHDSNSHSSQFTQLCFPFLLFSVCAGPSLGGSMVDRGEQVDGTDRMLELYDGVLLWPAVTADCWWQGSAISNKAATKFYHFLPCSTTPGLQPVSLWSLLELLLAVSSLREGGRAATDLLETSDTPGLSHLHLPHFPPTSARHTLAFTTVPQSYSFKPSEKNNSENSIDCLKLIYSKYRSSISGIFAKSCEDHSCGARIRL